MSSQADRMASKVLNGDYKDWPKIWMVSVLSEQTGVLSVLNAELEGLSSR